MEARGDSDVVKWRYFTPDDYEMVCQWWDGWKWPRIPLEMLPQVGIIVNGMCAAWIYQTDSNMCLVDWYISDRKAASRKGAIEYLLEITAQEAKRLGYSVIFSSVRNPNLIRKMEQSGFTGREDGMVNFIRAL